VRFEGEHYRVVGPSRAGAAAPRRDVTQLRDLIEQVVRGAIEVGEARSLLNQMTMRQNDWTLGAYCAQYCRIVSQHHTLEDARVFPHLKRRGPALVPIVDRLEQEHHVIARHDSASTNHAPNKLLARHR
jgi:hemerythrin-like domain-containing protein